MREKVDLETRWMRLFTELEKSQQSGQWDELHQANIQVLIGALHLVQPFDWPAWAVSVPDAGESLDHLSLIDCIKHITRIVRADRTNEGVLEWSVTAGVMAELCRVAHHKSQGQPIPSLDDLEPRD